MIRYGQFILKQERPTLKKSSNRKRTSGIFYKADSELDPDLQN